MRTNVFFAVFSRNFVGYFSSPTGYVFICAFVLMSAFAAFWPNEFFNRNLANLDQLNDVLPWILLVFVPAITMGVWADERRQGTDELLLTLPATDMEVVLGKYAAAVAIYTVSLVFSLSNVVVLMRLGDPDLGLLAANYVGYWFTGAAMIAVGAVASFLTANVTVGFVLAVAFNAPLVFAAYADAILPGVEMRRLVESFSIAAQFDDFAGGIIALSSVVYFVSIAVVMLYGCMVLIGRRHWVVRSATVPMSAHYGVRAIALVAIALGVNTLATRFDVRFDATQERLSSISDATRRILENLDPERPVIVEAYLSPTVPEAYVQTRSNLITMLREVNRIAGDDVIVRVNDTETYSPEAAEAADQFGIVPRVVADQSGGRRSIEPIYLGVAFLCGLDKVVVPFFDRGLPVEYEIVRSIATVSQQERKTIGIVRTDAELFGGFDMQRLAPRPDQAIVEELRKQYEVVPVEPTNLGFETYDVVLAVQPSSMNQAGIDHLVGAIRRGQPTAIFEDPLPYFAGNVPGTSEPRRPPSSNPFQQQQPVEPKGTILDLWFTLGVDFAPAFVVWDEFNPYPKVQRFEPELVFVGQSSGAEEPINRANPISRGIEEAAFFFPAAISPSGVATTEITPLLRTGDASGYVMQSDVLRRTQRGMMLNPERRHVPTGESYILAAEITGEGGGAAVEGDDARPVHVVLVSDMDVLNSAFFGMRAAGDDPEAPSPFNFDNVTFVLNALDALAGDDRFIDVRSRRPRHRTLTRVEQRVDVAQTLAAEERERFTAEFELQRDAEEAKLNAEIAALEQRENVDALEMGLEVAMRTRVGQNRLERTIQQLERERERELDRLDRELAIEIRSIQNTYKLAAVGLPPILPLVVAFGVVLRRRSLERLGVPATRLRSGTEHQG